MCICRIDSVANATEVKSYKTLSDQPMQWVVASEKQCNKTLKFATKNKSWAYRFCTPLVEITVY